MSITTVRVDNPLQRERRTAPVSLGVPFPSGMLRSPEALVVRNDQGNPVPRQVRTLARWANGSIKWLLVDYQASVGPTSQTSAGPTGTRAYQLEVGDAAEGPAPKDAIAIAEDAERLWVRTGGLEFTISKRRFTIFESLSLDGVPLVTEKEQSDSVVVDKAGQVYRASLDGDFRIQVAEKGPLRSVIKVSGRHKSPAGRTCLDFELRIHVRAGSPFVAVEHTFINREEPVEGISVRSIILYQEFHLEKDNYRLVRHVSGGYIPETGLVRLPGRVDLRIDGKMSLLADPLSVNDTPDRYPYHARVNRPLGQVREWLGLGDGSRGITTTIRAVVDNYPKQFSSEGHRLEWHLWPEWAGELSLSQGIAKTHEICIMLDSGKATDAAREQRLAEWEFPVHAIIPFDWYQKTLACNLDLALSYQPQKYPTIELLFHGLFQTVAKYYPYGTVWPRGMLNYGDDIDAEYCRIYNDRSYDPYQDVWTNNEYDYIYAAFVEYCRTGHPQFLRDVKITAQHLMDVDFIHYSTEPYRMGGVAHHSFHHTDGAVVGSHMWTEGLLGYYYLTGDPRALEIATAIGDNVLRHVEEQWQEVVYNAREVGWPLIALCAVYEATLEERFLRGAREIIDYIETANPGGSVMPDGDDAMVVGVALIGVKRFHRITGEERVRRLFLQKVDWWIDNRMLPEGVVAIWWYGFPHSAPSATPPFDYLLFPEALAYAYHLTGDVKYLKAGKLEMESALGTATLVATPRTQKPQAMYFRTWIDFLGAADKAGELRAYDRSGQVG